jgi:uncharacterized protein YqeY
MTLIQKVREQQVAARVARIQSASVLTTLLGEAQMVGKNNGNREPTDEEVVAVVQKFLKNIDETLRVASDVQVRETLQQEAAVLKAFLPRQMDKNELTELAKTCATMPAFMQLLKKEHAGQYDGKTASEIARSIFK